MRKIFIILLFAGLIVSEMAFAQNRRKVELQIGWNVQTSQGRISGPPFVRRVPGGEFRDVPFNEHFRIKSEGVWLYIGLRSANWKIAPGVGLFAFGGIVEPVGSDPEWGWFGVSFRYYFLRHKLWKRQRLLLYGLASLMKISLGQEKPWLTGYNFNKSFFLPELGVGANASIVHAEIKFHKWPGLVVGEAAEPGPGSSFSPKPIRLNHAVSVLLGIEFTLLKL